MSVCWRLKLALAGLVCVTVPSAVHAGKTCADPVEGGVSSGTTQEEALVGAQEWWSSRAGALGEGYGIWDNADDQALECSKDLKGDYKCKASARPCLPDGAPPEKQSKLGM
ncbi:hypothetical protein [uncultured Hyphomicrobium sp.]|uniref:hypothetical protein n=1 Tax=uncultured Hyphomicrobium sp. TaxID=194373 RepID=UPI0025FA35F0|nr:hypothetical protein [uncultured Hyphomicrobium sp.]